MKEIFAFIVIVGLVLAIVAVKPARTVERQVVVEKPIVKEVPRIIEKEVPKIIEKEVPVYRDKEVIKEVPVYRDREVIKEVPVYREKPQAPPAMPKPAARPSPNERNEIWENGHHFVKLYQTNNEIMHRCTICGLKRRTVRD
jgi:hypothetical protein